MIRWRPRSKSSDEAIIELFRSAYASKSNEHLSTESALAKIEARAHVQPGQPYHYRRWLPTQHVAAISGVLILIVVLGTCLIAFGQTGAHQAAAATVPNKVPPTSSQTRNRHIAPRDEVPLTHLTMTTSDKKMQPLPKPVQIGQRTYQNGWLLSISAHTQQTTLSFTYHLDQHGVASRFHAILDVPGVLSAAVKCQFSLITGNGQVMSTPPISSGNSLPLNISIGDTDTLTVQVHSSGPESTTLGCAMANPTVDEAASSVP